MILEMSSLPITSGIYGNPFLFTSGYINFYVPTKRKIAHTSISAENVMTANIQFVKE